MLLCAYDAVFKPGAEVFVFALWFLGLVTAMLLTFGLALWGASLLVRWCERALDWWCAHREGC